MIEPNNIYLGDCHELIKDVPDIPICIVTDPPFNVGYHYDGYKDNKTEEEYYQWLYDILECKKCPYVVIHYAESLYKLAQKVNKTPTKVVSWVYNSNTAKQHRDIAFFGVEPNFNKVKQPYKNINDKRIQERMANGCEGGRLYDWWNINQIKNTSEDKYDHPCIMPMEVMRNIVGILPEEYTIVDPFSGSGTTLKACQELGRQYIGFEINPKYYEISQDRLNNIDARGAMKLF